ncbi:dephospho-CoA kinase [Thioclava sp. SK-1]|uniref:dephospho-CoA kinase n=1 Tax=Thioclava sp. SK-1 TaxID=1889770 RepID=UPI000826179B|nr:dephospho-CoA kinase [Thioclava sp. SK-1]OCX65328.1 dephospho-CoA kinase [Thioclava sp. SK-1]
MSPFCLGLTGSIGTGKSTTAQMFRDAGVSVWDADATVRALYAKGGAAVEPLRQLFPAVITADEVDRSTLKSLIASDETVLAQLEAIVHPLTQSSRNVFLRANADADLVVLDIPLLFETGADLDCDAVLVVTVAPEVQRARVLARGTMTEDQLDMILARQMPDAEKRIRADFILRCDTLEDTRAGVQNLIKRLTT